MKKMLPVLLRAGIAALFIFSGYQKLLQPHENFLAVVLSFELAGGAAAELAARILPWVEFVVGVFLFLGIWSRAAAAGLLLLSTFFLGALISAVLRHLPIDRCGCFGEGVSIPLKQMIFVDFALWLSLLYLLCRPAEHLSLDHFYNKT